MVHLTGGAAASVDYPTQVRTVRRLDLTRETIDLTRGTAGYERGCIAEVGHFDEGPQALEVHRAYLQNA